MSNTATQGVDQTCEELTASAEAQQNVDSDDVFEPEWDFRKDQSKPIYILNHDHRFVRWSAQQAKPTHLMNLHTARCKLVATHLPKAKVIVDLGGANGSIFQMGYPYKFDNLTVVDLPPEDRCDMYKDRKIPAGNTHAGPIYTLFTNMTDLSAIPSQSVDLVWSGQSIEHITEEQASAVYKEVIRILKPEGSFCLDTPNRLMTGIHIGTDEWIHPEHKLEYTPDHLQRNLREAGFEIIDQLGVVEMINTYRQGYIDYRDFYANAGLSTLVDRCYIQYYHCKIAPPPVAVEPEPAPVVSEIPAPVAPPETVSLFRKVLRKGKRVAKRILGKTNPTHAVTG